jgi:hypothetical protein
MKTATYTINPTVPGGKAIYTIPPTDTELDTAHGFPPISPGLASSGRRSGRRWPG